MKLSDLRPNDRNPRKITDDQMKRLKKSLAKFGDLSGIVFNEVTKTLVGGHQRIEALEGAEIEITQEFDEPTKTGTTKEGFILFEGERHKYRQVRWDETAQKAATIAANKHGGDWYYPLLVDQLIELDASNIDLDLTGFSHEEITSLLDVKTDDKDEDDEDKERDVKSSIVTCPSCNHRFDPKDKIGDDD